MQLRRKGSSFRLLAFGFLIFGLLFLAFPFDRVAAAEESTLTVNKSGLGSGVVKSTPAGIDCGSDCSASFGANSAVTLTAVPDIGSAFVKWSSNCVGTGSTCTITMNANETVTATFTNWREPASGPPWNNRKLPINSSDVPQTKAGSLIIDNTLFGSKILAVNKLGVGFTKSNDLDSTALLDVAGQIRIRGGNPGPGKVLMVDALASINGLARWSEWPSLVSTLEEDFGIKIYSSPTAKIVATASTTVVQNRITGDCNASPARKAIKVVNQDGTVGCLDLVSSINDNSSSIGGLNISNLNGSLTLALNPSPTGGLVLSGSPAKLTVKPPVAGSGLILMNNYLQFATTTNLVTPCSGTNVYLKYNTATGWNCNDPNPPQPPGDSVAYFKAISGVSYPISCPDASTPGGAWAEVGSVTTENATPTGGRQYVRTCIHLVNPSLFGKVCRVLYLKDAINFPLCPTQGLDPPNSTGWSSLGLYTEYGGDDSSRNNVNVCMECF